MEHNHELSIMTMMMMHSLVAAAGNPLCNRCNSTLRYMAEGGERDAW